MGTKAIEQEKLTETITLSLCTDGYWLYDETRGMNLAMQVKTRDEAIIKAFKYYQKRLLTVEKDLKEIRKSVETFIESVTDDEIIN